MIRLARVFALSIGGLTLLWQAWEVINGRLFNQFLIADVLLGLGLIVAALLRNRLYSSLAMLIAYAYSVGVFMVATTGGLLMSKYDFGAFTTTLGLVPCSLFTVFLCRWLIQKALKPV